MSSLRELEIGCADQLTTGGLKTLFESSSLSSLTYLDLTGCSGVTDDVVQALCHW